MPWKGYLTQRFLFAWHCGTGMGRLRTMWRGATVDVTLSKACEKGGTIGNVQQREDETATGSVSRGQIEHSSPLLFLFLLFLHYARFFFLQAIFPISLCDLKVIHGAVFRGCLSHPNL